MKKKQFKSILSCILTALLILGVFAVPVSASVADLPTRNDLDWFTKNNPTKYASYGVTDALHSIYGMPVYDIEAQSDHETGLAQHAEWYGSKSGDNYGQVFYPDHIFLDVNESLEDARYAVLALAHYGNDNGYRFMINGLLWGEVKSSDGSVQNGDDPVMYTIFDNFGHLATYTDGTTIVRNGTSHDLTNIRNKNYKHAEYAEFNGYVSEYWSFDSENPIEPIVVLGRTTTGNPFKTLTNQQVYKEFVFLKGTPQVQPGTYEYIYNGTAQVGALQDTGWGSSTFNNDFLPFTIGASNSWTTVETDEDLMLRMVITIYDKEGLNAEIGVSDSFASANVDYVSKYETSGKWSDFENQLAASKTVLTTRELGTYPEKDEEKGYPGFLNYITIPEGADPAQTVINESESALDAAKRAVTFAASDVALYSRISALETLLSGHEDEYTAASVAALRARIAEVKALRTAKSAERTGEQYTTDAFSFADNATPGALAAAEQAIIDAITFPELVRKSDAPADFSEYVLWIGEHDDPDPCHTAESIANYTEKLAVIADMYAHREDYIADDQATVDAAMDAVRDAWDALAVEHGRAAEPAWVWAPVYAADGTTPIGYTSATAQLDCDRNHDHDQTVIDTDLDVTGGDPDCEHSATKTYTASVTLKDKDDVDRTYTDSKTVTLPATGHNYNLSEFEWTETADGYTAKAVLVCRNDASHMIREDAVVTYTGEANCDAEVERVYTATYGDQTEEKVITLDRIDHDWKTGKNDILWNWTDNGDDTFTVTATFVCSRYAAHTVTKTATVTKEQTKDPTEDKKGENTHTATVTGPDGNEYTDEKKTEIPELPHTHNYEFDRFNWVEIKNKDGIVTGYKPDMTATLVCAKDNAEKTENVRATVEHTEPACQVKGSDVYTAAYGDHTETKTVELPALDHVWGEPTWTVNADKTKTTATFICALNSAHVYTVTCDLTETVTVQPTPDEEGEKEYTGTVTGPDGHDYDYRETEEIDPLGHTYEGPDWTWTGDDDNGWTAEATFTCTTETGHTEHPAVTMTDKLTKAPTCTGTGVKTYTATTVFEGKTYTAVKNVVLPATGHDWGEPAAKWNGGEVTVTVVCRNDASHVKTLEANVTADVEVEPYCTTTGKTHYTATVVYEGTTYTFENDAITPALGHDWGEWETIKEATATEHGLERRVCRRCGEVEERETVIEGKGSRKIQFTNMNDMHFVVQMLYHERAVYHNSEYINWYENLPLTFRIVSYSTYDYTKYVVYVNRQIIAPNEDGSYTIPAGSGFTMVTVTGASNVPESEGSVSDQTSGASKGKVNFIDALTAFFRRIADFFRGLFK